MSAFFCSHPDKENWSRWVNGSCLGVGAQFSKASEDLGLVELAYRTHRSEWDPALPGTFKLSTVHGAKGLASTVCAIPATHRA